MGTEIERSANSKRAQCVQNRKKPPAGSACTQNQSLSDNQ